MLLLLALCVLLPVIVIAVRRASGAARTALPPRPASSPGSPQGSARAGRRAGRAVAGLLTVALLAASCAAPGGTDVDENAPVQLVRVEAVGMRFLPDTIEVPSGTRLQIELVNDDPSLLHDLTVPGRAATARLYPGQSETIDVGVITEDIEAYCTVSGHRQMGMVLTIVAVDP